RSFVAVRLRIGSQAVRLPETVPVTFAITTLNSDHREASLKNAVVSRNLPGRLLCSLVRGAGQRPGNGPLRCDGWKRWLVRETAAGQCRENGWRAGIACWSARRSSTAEERQ